MQRLRDYRCYIQSLTLPRSYTHYWAILGVGDAVWQTAWPRLIQDTQRIVEAAGVAVSRADGNGAYPPTVDAEAGIRLNGADESHESFIFTLQEGFGFCKTAGKPYDLVVVCILLRAYMLAPQNVKVW